MESQGSRISFLRQKNFPYVHNHYSNAALAWLADAYEHEYGKGRPLGLHIVGDSGMGKSRIFKFYKDSLASESRDDEGRKYQGVMHVEVSSTGSHVDLCNLLADACVPDFKLRRGVGMDKELCRLLKQFGVRQILIDEAGNFLNGGPKSVSICLSTLKSLSNAGFALSIATTMNWRNVLASDEQLGSRFTHLKLSRWEESLSFRSFLKGVERYLPLPSPSGLDKREHLRWLLSHNFCTTDDILRVLIRASIIAISEDEPCLSRSILERAELLMTPNPAVG